MICPNCKKEISDSYQVCGFCGTILPIANSAPAKKKVWVPIVISVLAVVLIGVIAALILSLTRIKNLENQQANAHVKEETEESFVNESSVEKPDEDIPVVNAFQDSAFFETSEEQSIVSAVNTMEPTGKAVPADSLLNAAVMFDGRVAVSFVRMDKDASTIMIRIDNSSDEDIRTQSFPKTIADGTEILMNPLGKNQQVSYVTIPAGQYVLITYKVDVRCLTALSLQLTEGTVQVVSTGDIDYYDLTIH